MADSDQPAAAAAVSADLGQTLREARVAKDLTLDQIATELRIEARQLAALEDNRFEQIGPPVFVKGYIRQYGQRLGLDQRVLMEVYGKQTNIADVQVTPKKPIRLRDERQITVWVVALLVLLLIAVGLAVWYLNGGGFALPSGGVQSPSAKVEPAPAATPQTPEPAPVFTEVATVEAPSDAESQVSETERAPMVAQPVVATVTVAPAVTAAPSPASRGPAPISLDVTFDSESWAEITDARGQRLFFELGTTGRHAVMKGEPPISVTFGNGDAVRLAVNGERYTIPTQGRQGKLVRFTIASEE